MADYSGITQAGRAVGGRVQNAIATASRRTGVDFGYLLGQAQIESSLDPDARARTSSATGLFQFIDQSWLGVINSHGARHGLGWAADAIQRSAGGRYYVADPGLRQQIMDLRKHPETASVMAAEFASENRDFLEQRIGRAAEPVDLYLAHFLGAAGAAKFLTSDPSSSGAALFPQAARANRSIFYDRQGNDRSLAEIRSDFARKLSNGARDAGAEVGFAGTLDGWSLPQGSAAVQPADYVRIEQARLAQSQEIAQATADYPEFAPKAETARLAYLMLATFGR